MTPAPFGAGQAKRDSSITLRFTRDDKEDAKMTKENL